MSLRSHRASQEWLLKLSSVLCKRWPASSGRRRPGTRRPFLGLGLLLFVAVTLLAGRPAVARSHGERRQVREVLAAERLRSEGGAALARKDFAAATRAFSALYRLTLQPEGLYRLGVLASAEGRLLDAQDLMRRFVSDSRFDPAESPAEAAEAQRILALPRLPSGRVSVIGERGTLLFVDGHLVGALPLSRPLLCAPGKRILALENGHSRQEEEIDLAVGRFVEVTFARGSAALLSAELPAALVLEQYGELPQAAAAPLAQVIEDVLQADRLSPFPLPVALERAGLARPSTCVETLACLLQLARKNELEYVLKVQLIKQAPGAILPWQLRLSLLDVEVGEEAARSEETCASCDLDKAVAVLRSGLPRLLATARTRPRGELKVTSTPAGAEVRLGARVLGKTPVEQPVWAGLLEVEATLPGYESQRLPVTVSPGEPTAVHVPLLLEAAEPPPAALTEPVKRHQVKSRPRWRLAVGGVAVVGSALLIGFGASALAVSDQCVVEALSPVTFCRERFGTAGVGTGLLISGAAALLTGTLLLAIPERRR